MLSLHIKTLNTESIPAMIVGAAGFAIGQTAVKQALKFRAQRQEASAKKDETVQEYVARKA
jgi:hypothetical protein